MHWRRRQKQATVSSATSSSNVVVNAVMTATRSFPALPVVVDINGGVTTRAAECVSRRSTSSSPANDDWLGSQSSGGATTVQNSSTTPTVPISAFTRMRATSGVGTGGWGGSINRGPRAPAVGLPNSGATEKF